MKTSGLPTLLFLLLIVSTTQAQKRKLGGNYWSTENLNIDIPGSYCYDNNPGNCNRYGRLYTWQTAQKGCKMLGEGWRLPTNADWEQLTDSYGGVRTDSIHDGKAAFAQLVKGGESGFNVLFGGGRRTSGEFARMEAHGFFWTATETGAGTAWLYNFGGAKFVNRHDDTEKEYAASVRCVWDDKQK